MLSAFGKRLVSKELSIVNYPLSIKRVLPVKSCCIMPCLMAWVVAQRVSRAEIALLNPIIVLGGVAGGIVAN
jgi:hypothetical protein